MRCSMGRNKLRASAAKGPNFRILWEMCLPRKLGMDVMAKEVSFRTIVEIITMVRIKMLTVKKAQARRFILWFPFCTIYQPFGKPTRNPKRLAAETL